MAVVTQADRLKSVRNRCVIELFVALFVLSPCPFDISVGEGAFCHRTESDLFIFLLKQVDIEEYLVIKEFVLCVTRMLKMNVTFLLNSKLIRLSRRNI